MRLEISSLEFVDIVLIQRAEINYYPPVINAVNVLGECGLKVVIIDGGKNNSFPSLPSNVHVYRPFVDQSDHGLYSSWNFAKSVWKVLRRFEPSICIAYDQPAAALIGLIPFKGKKIFHYHEYPCDYDGDEQLFFRLQNKVAVAFSNSAEMLCFPDSHRASAFFRENRLAIYPEIVKNCPAKLEELPQNKLKDWLIGLGVKPRWVLIFQGAVCSNYYSENIVASMEYWPEGAIMVFIGPVNSEFRSNLEEMASHLGVMHRLYFRGQVPYLDLFSYTVEADITFTMIKPVTFNFRHMAGASNKRYEAIACGIPQISNIGPGMTELIEDNGVGICIDPANPETIGNAVTELLLNPERRREMGKKARELHLNKFNYEQEFDSVLKIIKKWCRGANAAQASIDC